MSDAKVHCASAALNRMNESRDDSSLLTRDTSSTSSMHHHTLSTIRSLAISCEESNRARAPIDWLSVTQLLHYIQLHDMHVAIVMTHIIMCCVIVVVSQRSICGRRVPVKLRGSIELLCENDTHAGMRE